MNEKKENINQINELLISSYKIIGILGKGSFGIVKLGIHILTNEKVAIKIISKANEKHNILTETEISILKSINHQNIIKVFDVIETKENFYIIFEYISGGELQKFIQIQGRLNQNTIMKIFYQLIIGISYLHNNNIIHRDLKPENILLTKNEEIKIIDFGLAIQLNKNNTLLKSQCGSINYCSPEIIKGEEYNGKLADIWSIGIILYFMNCGYLPFIGKNNKEIQKNIISCKIEFPSNIPFIIKDLLSKILVINPNNRISIKEIMKHTVFKHGKRIFMNDNIIYDYNTNCIKECILKKCEEIANEYMNQFENINNINKLALKEILKNKALKETNWSNCLSGFSTEYKKDKRDSYFFKSFSPSNIESLTPRDIIKKINKIDDTEILDNSIIPIKNKLKLNVEKKKQKNKLSLSSKKTRSINIKSILKESKLNINNNNNNENLDNKITIKVYKNSSYKKTKNDSYKKEINKNKIQMTNNNINSKTIEIVKSGENIPSFLNNKIEYSQKKISSQSSKFTLYFTNENIKPPSKMFPFKINYPKNKSKNKSTQCKLKPYIKKNINKKEDNSSKNILLQKSNENSSYIKTKSLIITQKNYINESIKSPVKSFNNKKVHKVNIVKLSTVSRYSDKKCLDNNDRLNYNNDNNVKNNNNLSKNLHTPIKKINTSNYENYINLNINHPVKISVKLNELCNNQINDNP
jgi:5'-AMP-activated protein kinase catalytic alpha subunit